ncbi:PepSY domain-containing protein [Microbispora cellulosiformans]|uniref:PepSY domain-containing protein n=1 Tax=Microbispora cellulosiformans TaxID=2614688 RepID=A0A5J5K364_9ACTN|nr:PepSY domain-containing protein [Microbispora cellulosiformans]KAA9377560.1 PepSY domain-containing protein [Microbispora cellulosiformans]
MRKTTSIAIAAAATIAALAAGGTAVASASAPVQAPASVQAAPVQARAHTPALSSATPARSVVSRSRFTRREAIIIAKRRVPGARVTKVEREWEHGHRTWKVELRRGHREYRVYVSIATGRIVKFRSHHS